MVEIDEEATKEEVSSPDKENEFFIATVYGGNEGKPEDLPEKCADPGPCFVTCKIGKVYVPDYLCDPGACASNFSLEVGDVIEIFQPTRPPIPQEESVHQARKQESVGEIKQKTADPTVTPKQKNEQKTPTPVQRSKQKKEDTKAVKKKKPKKEKKERKAELNCTNFKDLLGKLKNINSAIIKDGGIGAHLVEDNSKLK
ncbi:hypothetical protein PIB30_060898 [Stylosanthes scabra]|uniref:Uncharacterized protein n=1 Tax=Stylosanthes scabra TaxID=79078 RepID=A0ABU6VJ38_9FABA|nr:hypothetical protein [Stylosanthes scabra]